jgi:hypothetical protein
LRILPIAPEEVRVHDDVALAPTKETIIMERELWNRISTIVTAVDRKFGKERYTHSVGRIVRVYLWAVLNERPVDWACRRENWRGVRPPEGLPDQSRMSRRLRQPDTKEFLFAVLDSVDLPAQSELLKIIDGKPLPISRHSQDADARFGRGAGGLDKGYKFHAIYGGSGRLLAWQVHAMNMDEKEVGCQMVQELSDEGYLLGDANYDASRLYVEAAAHGHQLVAARSKPHSRLGHRPHVSARLRSIALLEGPSEFGRSLYTQRRQIESRFGNLCSFGGGLICLPPWVRTLHRVRTYVSAKLVIRLARNAIVHQSAA